MSVLQTIGNRLTTLLRDRKSHQADSRFLFYLVELTAEKDSTREDFNERAQLLQRNLSKVLCESGHFTTAHLDRTIDPYIALGASYPDLWVTDYDERVQDHAEQAKKRHPWPEGTEYDTAELIAGFETPEEAQLATRNCIAFEATLEGGTDVGDGYGSAAPIENARKLIARYVIDADDIETIERLRPVEEGWYGFRYSNHEIRVRAVAEDSQPYVEWKAGSAQRCPRGHGWVEVVDDEQYGLTNGRLHLDRHDDDELTQEYFSDDLESIPMPKQIAESLLEDARAV